ncbi:MAG: SBBP repeat-containing protein [Anaerolineales bacterium]|nr:SBBP repeat-containing protein [Anaerolineales bacterium]
MAVDGNGNVYITGESGASWNGPSGQTPLHPYTSGDDVFVLKLNSSGVYQWHTFYGGDDESGEGIAVDENGNVYVSGNSNVSWNGPSGQAPLNPYSGDADILVLKLDSNGAYQWHTYLGNSTSDDSFDIAVGGGNIYVTGVSGLSWNGPGSTSPLHGLTGYGDVVIAKLNTNGAYQWHTFYGGNASHATGYGVDIDNNGNAIVVGEANSTWPLPSAALNSYSGGKDIFALKLNSAGAYQWHTFYGSAGEDSANDVAIDGNDNIYVAGSSVSTWNGPGSILPLSIFKGGSQDIAVVKLAGSGVYQWHTFQGSSSFDSSEGVDVDTSGTVYITGYTDVTAKSSKINNILPYFGNADIVIAWMNPQGTVLGNTTYPSSAFDIAVDNIGNVYVTGDSSHSWNQTGSIAPLHSHSGSDEIVVIKTQLSTLPYVASITRTNPNPSSAANLDFTVTFSKSVTGVDLTDFTLTTSGVSGATVSGLSGSGSIYTVTVSNISGAGTLSLNLIDNDSILDGEFNPLGGSGIGNGTFNSGEMYMIIKASAFADVPESYWANSYIERLYNASVTGGCSTVPLNYCPDSVVTRAQMAVFLLKGVHGSNYVPPAVNGNTGFTDVSADYWAAAWIKQLAAEGITSGCGNGNYCPDSTVTRAQMAIFLMKAKNGSSYVPPAVGVSTGFADVAIDYWAAAFIKQLVVDGITSGCGNGNYCPGDSVTRAQMAVFLVKAFNLP